MTEKMYTREYFQKMGKKGGLKTKKKHGVAHFKKMGKKSKPKKVDKLV